MSNITSYDKHRKFSVVCNGTKRVLKPDVFVPTITPKERSRFRRVQGKYVSTAYVTKKKKERDVVIEQRNLLISHTSYHQMQLMHLMDAYFPNQQIRIDRNRQVVKIPCFVFYKNIKVSFCVWINFSFASLNYCIIIRM